MSLGGRLAIATTMLAAAGLEQPRREARRLLCHATGLDAAGLLRELHADHPTPGFEALVARRAAREPLALITGRQPFWSFEVAVSADTLVPRADSETLVEAALETFPGRDARRVLDLGTGTGCLLLAVLTEFPGAFGIGVDWSAAAAALARRNAWDLRLDGRAAMVCGYWATALQARFDLVLSNPPYIETAAIAGLMPEVSQHEPALALDGGTDGLDAYRSLMEALPGLLTPAGVAILEMGAGQLEAVSSLAREAGLRPGAARPDLAGVPRALPIRLPRKKSFGEPGRRR